MVLNSGFSPLFAAEASVWLTPVWLVGVGAGLGLLLLAVALGLVWLVSRPAASGLIAAVREGFFAPAIGWIVIVAGLAVAVTAFAFAGTLRIPINSVIKSVGRLASGEPRTFEVQLAADAKDQELDLVVRPAEAGKVKIETNRDILFAVEPPNPNPALAVARTRLGVADPAFEWEKAASQKYLFVGDRARLFLTNNSGLPATVTVTLTTQAEHPEAIAIPATAAFVVLFLGGVLLLRSLCPRVTAIATTTAKEAIAQPVFQIVLVSMTVLLLGHIFVPYNTFGEDVKMVKEFGLTLVMVSSIFIAVWTSSVGLAEEIDGRTALTVLSKPIGRVRFLMGKFLGVLLPVLLMFLVLGTVLLATVSYKVVYDARESALPDPVWQLCYAEMMSVLPGLALALMETVIMASISLAIATRLPMLANLTISLSIYLIGHLLPLLVLSKKIGDTFGLVQFAGRLFSLFLPVLEHFNIYAAVAGGTPVPLSYLGAALAYCAIYSSIAL